MVQLFNIGALFVLMRETLEACIVLGVMLNYISKALPEAHQSTQRIKLKKMVWIGTIIALVLSIILGIALTVIYYVLRANIFEDLEALWEGCFKLVAVILLTWLAFSMLYADDWAQKWEAKIANAVDDKGKNVEEAEATLPKKSEDLSGAMVVVDDEKDVAAGEKGKDGKKIKKGILERPIGLLIFAFTVVIREGVESIVFLTGVGQGEPFSVIIPGVLGIAIGLAAGYFFWKHTNSLHIRSFLFVSSVVLFVIAAGLAAGVAHEFEEYSYARQAARELERLDAILPPNITAPDFVGGAPSAKLLKRWEEIEATVDSLQRRQDEQWAPDSPPARSRVVDAACPRNATTTGNVTCTVRTYYIGAVEEDWDYAPSGYNHVTGVPFVRDPDDSGVWTLRSTSPSARRIGSTYIKAMYYEFTDDKFTVRKRKAPEHGFLGPIIRAEVGDVIRVVFKNLATRPYGMHPHGVSYDTQSEGARTEWRTAGSAVPPNEVYTYTWTVPERAGPASGDGSSLLWAYHSHFSEPRDVNSGLAGPLIIYTKGTLSPTTDLPTDVSKEYILFLSVMDENQSWYLQQNIEKYLSVTDPSTQDSIIADADFAESNLMHSINGRSFNNMAGLTIPFNSTATIAWHAFALGTEVDLHTLHFHGATGLIGNHRADVVELLPASFKTLRMDPAAVSAPGNWLVHCHVNDHITAGMVTSFYVQANASDVPPTWDARLSNYTDIEPYFSTLFPESTPILWDASSCCSEDDNAFFQILNALIGWMAVATVATVCAYFGYWVLVIVGVVVLRSHMAKKQKRAAEEEQTSLMDDSSNTV